MKTCDLKNWDLGYKLSIQNDILGFPSKKKKKKDHVYIYIYLWNRLIDYWDKSLEMIIIV